jgi:hypothetical protein
MSKLEGLSDGQIHDIGLNAYVYLYPLVTMDVTRRQMTNNPSGEMAGHGPINTFVHIREFPSAEFKEVVRPNFDTLYSSAWLDLSDGPIVVSTGPVADGRYYELPIYDMWTDAFAVPGERTSGTNAGQWALVPPGWHGELPEGLPRIDAPTPTVWIIGRTQTNGPGDYAAVAEIQDGFGLTPLADWGGSGSGDRPFTRDPSVDMATPPLLQVNSMSAEAFFDEAMRLLAIHPPHTTDWSLVEQMRRIGVVGGSTYSDLAPKVRSQLDGVPAEGRQTLIEMLPRLAKTVNGWQMNIDTMGVYGNFYVKRAIVAMIGLGANSAEDAIYPVLMADADGEPVSGDHAYVLHFDADDLPPVRAFWSVTMYDSQGFQAANELDRFAIGDRDDLHYNTDGSLDIFVQHTSPGSDHESNWLPAPRGPLGITMRLYAPKAEALLGKWNPPPMQRVAAT